MTRLNKSQTIVYDIFQKGLIRGSASLPFDPEKHYFYVEHPTEGWRVYLRSACFIHEIPKEGDRCIDPTRFLVVHRTGAKPGERAWEMPKGQMEGKDALRAGGSIYRLLEQNVRREVAEESHLKRIRGLRYTGKCYQNREADYPPNHVFQYHIFQALVEPGTLETAQKEFEWLRAHPAAFRRLKRDKREKDDVQWYEPGKMKLSSRWSPGIIAMYIEMIKLSAENRKNE
jgi:ADP-ribose pyrophosphatase YjhB (NUDIX family)